MKIETSSAEMQINGQMLSALFGFPPVKWEKIDEYTTRWTPLSDAELNVIEKKWIPMTLQDLNNLNTWDSYKQEISGLFPTSYACGSAHFLHDVNGNRWAVLGGTGFCYYWSVGK
jgi:hypothetical protein